MIQLVEAVASPLQAISSRTLVGPFAVLDEFNRNGRRYPRDIYENAYQELVPKIQSRSLLGECDHPLNYDEIRLSNVSHVITECSIKDTPEGKRVVEGVVELLDTPAGRVVQALVEAGIPIGISSRGVGNTKRVREGEEVTQLKLITYDLVAEPSFANAVLSEARASALGESLNRIESNLPLNESKSDSPTRKMIQSIRESFILSETSVKGKVDIKAQEIRSLRDLAESQSHTIRRGKKKLRENSELLGKYEKENKRLQTECKEIRESLKAARTNMGKLQDSYNKLVETTVQKDVYESLQEQVVTLRKRLAVERRGLSYSRVSHLLEGLSSESEIDSKLDTFTNLGRRSASFEVEESKELETLKESSEPRKVSGLSSIISKV